MVSTPPPTPGVNSGSATEGQDSLSGRSRCRVALWVAVLGLFGLQTGQRAFGQGGAPTPGLPPNAIREGAAPSLRGTRVRVQVLDVRGKLMDGIKLPTQSQWQWVDIKESSRDAQGSGSGGVGTGSSPAEPTEATPSPTPSSSVRPKKGKSEPGSSPDAPPNGAQGGVKDVFKDAPSRRPVLRVWVQLPPGTKVRTEAVAELKEAGTDIDLDPDDSPYGKGIAVLGVTTRLSQVVIPAELKIGDQHEVNLVIRILAERPEFFVDPLCEAVGIQAHRRKDQGKHLYSAISCQDRVTEIGLYLLSPDTGTSIITAGLGNEAASGANWKFYRFRKPKEGEGTGRTLGFLRVSREGQDPTEYTEHAIVYQPFIPRSRFRLGVGTGLTLSSYREQITEGKISDIQVTQLGWTVKVDAGYSLIPKVLDVGMNTFFTVLPIWRTPQTYQGARFYGINGRLGYRLPIDLGALELMVLTGWYAWGMWVDSADNPYGVALMSGPQIFLSMRMAQVGYRTFGAYFKYAPINYKPALALGNYELALGGSFQLNSPSARRAIMLTLDLSMTSITLQRDTAYNIRQAHQLNMYTASLGVTIPLL